MFGEVSIGRRQRGNSVLWVNEGCVGVWMVGMKKMCSIEKEDCKVGEKGSYNKGVLVLL